MLSFIDDIGAESPLEDTQADAVERLSFRNTCINTPQSDMDLFDDMRRDATAVTRTEFLRHVDMNDMRELEAELGYARNKRHDHGLTMKNDWHVAYYKSHWGDKPCYYFVWSGIEHYFY